jgi:CBS-domain-containing membrane protein
VLAAVLAITGTMAGQRDFRAMHPPAAATTMLIALGSFAPDWRTLSALTAGVLLVCLIGEAARLFRHRLGRHFGSPEGRNLEQPAPGCQHPGCGH